MTLVDLGVGTLELVGRVKGRFDPGSGGGMEVPTPGVTENLVGRVTRELVGHSSDVQNQLNMGVSDRVTV